MQKPITKAIIAAAGYGSRFLPQTKAIPKEMLPLVDKPVIQHIVEELVEAGITDIIIVTSDGKPAIEEHFGKVSDDLKQNLLDGGKHLLLAKSEAIASIATFTYVKQSGPYGNATPLMSAAHLLNDEPFIYAFADDFVVAQPNRFQQLIAEHNKHGGSVLTCVRRSGAGDYSRYGYVGGCEVTSSLIQVETIIEKPGSREKSPSNLASVGGYLLEAAIIPYLQRQLANYEGGQEFQIQDAMQLMMADDLKFYGCEILGGRYYDTGNPLEYMKTVYDFALQHVEIGPAFRAYVVEQQLLQEASQLPHHRLTKQTSRNRVVRQKRQPVLTR